MPPPPSSDYGDDDFDFDDSTLAAITEAEQNAIVATQAPKKGYHHTIPRPAAGPRATETRKAPPPLNTEPRVSGCGFGWEPGGKHATRLANGLPINGMARFNTQDESPAEMVVDDKGRYGFGSADDEQVYDQRKRPEIRQMVEAAARDVKPPKRVLNASQQAGSQARRDAILGAMPLQPRQLTRSTSANALSGPPAGNNASRFPQRAFARAASTGTTQTNTRVGFAGPSRVGALPPIGSQGTPPPSQGAASRRAVFELENERRRREELEEELRALRAQQAEARRRGSTPKVESLETGEDPMAEIARLKQALYVAQGQAATAKRNQEASDKALHAEINQLKENMKAMEAAIQERVEEGKKRLEDAKAQAVFSNHQALTSAAKARQQQSQWNGSQRGPQGSPLRDKTAATPAPLVRSAVKAKSMAPPPPPPRFDGLANAFDRTPTLGKRQQRPDASSPSRTPTKRQRVGSSSPVASPFRSQSQPTRSPQQGTPVYADGDVSMDWQPDFSEAMTLDTPQLDDARDSKAELQYHLLNHVASSPLHLAFNNWHEPTLFRVLGYNLDGAKREVLQRWKAGQNGLLTAVGVVNSTFEVISADLIFAFTDMFAALKDHREALMTVGKPVVLAQIDIDLLRLFSSTVLLFPAFPSANPQAIGQIAYSLNVLSRSLNCNSKEKLVEHWAGANMHTTEDPHTLVREDLAKHDQPEAVVERELGDAVAEAGEALCLADGKSLWHADELSSTILNLTMSDDPTVVARGLDLFVVAACRPEHFRQLVTKSDSESGGLTLMDRVSRFLLNGHPKFTPQQRFQYSRDVLRALAMVSRSDEDAVVLMAEGSILVPTLAVLLHRQSSLLWGIRSSNRHRYDPMDLITPTMLLLHHVMFPPPFTKALASSQIRPGVDFVDPDALLFASAPPQGTALGLGRLLTQAGSMPEFKGVENFYVSALGPIAYSNADLREGAWAYASQPPGDINEVEGRRKDVAQSDLSIVQYLAQDLLNAFVEGPEGDSVYEIYDEDRPQPQDLPNKSEVIVISDDEDFDEEERLMHDDDTWGEFDE